MKIIKPSFEILTSIDGNEILKHIERVGRTCYKSEDKITESSALQFVANIVKRGHEAVIEHYSISVKVICDRGVSHEIVRHRLASYSQESTRYCNYSKDKFDGELIFIKPCFWGENSYLYNIWRANCKDAEWAYLMLLENGATPEQARTVLPNSLKTELIMTMNLREWRHFFKLRAAKPAHPQIKEIAIPMLKAFKEKLPIVFDDIIYDEEFAQQFGL